MPTLSSSNLSSCEYDPASRVLSITFHSGRTYRYADVSEDTYQSLLNAPSAGRYFNSAIKDVYSEA